MRRDIISHKSYKISVHKVIEWVGNSVRYEKQDFTPKDISATAN